MSLRSGIVAQFRQPHGPLGALAGTIMAHRPSNRRRNRWTVATLEVGAGARCLELGCGPGLAVEAALRRGVAFVLALDHSATMIAQAQRRNAAWLRAGRLELRLGGVEALVAGDGQFDAAWMINVAQFLHDRPAVLGRLAAALVPGGRLAVTYQPRHHGATAADATRFAATVAAEMSEAGLAAPTVAQLDLRPVPAICVIGTGQAC